MQITNNQSHYTVGFDSAVYADWQDAREHALSILRKRIMTDKLAPCRALIYRADGSRIWIDAEGKVVDE